jgi:hypothetical protein
VVGALSNVLAGIAVLVAGFLISRPSRIRGALAVALGGLILTGAFLTSLHAGDGLTVSHIIIGLATTEVGFVPYG